MASQDDAVWHLLIDNAQRGPLRRSEILASLLDGTIDGANLVWRPGFKDWLPLREVSEFWTPSPRKPEPTSAPPPPPLSDVPTKPPGEEWSLWGAATIGLALFAFLQFQRVFTGSAYRLATTGYTPNAGLIGELLGELLGLPLLFVLIAVIRNTVRRRNLRPSSASAGRRAAAFFGILIAVAISLRVFGTIYFSSDEVISGPARADIVSHAVTGCLRSQRAAAANTGAAETQINSFCNCLANSIVSNLTYKQLGKSMELDIRRASLQAAESCRGPAGTDR